MPLIITILAVIFLLLLLELLFRLRGIGPKLMGMHFFLPDPEIDFARPHRDYPLGRLAAFCAAEGIPFISTFAAIVEASVRATLYFPRDGHLNPVGYDLVARVVAEGLDRMGLVPPAGNGPSE